MFRIFKSWRWKSRQNIEVDDVKKRLKNHKEGRIFLLAKFGVFLVAWHFVFAQASCMISRYSKSNLENFGRWQF